MRTFPLQDGRLVLKILAAAGICVLLAITLWPFNPWPRNEVSWLHDEDGLRLCGHGTILSVAQFRNEAGAENQPFSLEFWMVPWRDEGSTVMFAFYVRENPGQFVVRQDGLDVSVSHTIRQREEKNHHPLVAGQMIAPNKRTLVTVTAGPKETTLYVNGQAQSTSQSFGLSRRNLTGEFVIGTSPVENEAWCGILHGIAIYKNELTAQEVASHYKTWLSSREEGRIDKRSILALYLFRERSGTLVRNEIQPGVDLRIPRHYTIRRRNVLLPPWKEFRTEWSYVRGLILNVLGFDPISLFSSCARVKATLANELCHRYNFEPDHRDSTVIPADAWFGLDRCHRELSRHCARCEHVLFQRRTRYFEETIRGKSFRKILTSFRYS